MLAATVAVMLFVTTASVRAQPVEPVALLPLDAEARFEIYGQPVAAEIARSLTDGKLTVVVVDAKMAVPANAKLVVAGSITAKGSAVMLGISVRNPVDGTVTDKLEEPAANVAGIGKAAAKLAERLLPVVRARLDVLRSQPKDPGPDPIARPRPAVEPVILVGIGVPLDASLTMEPFRRALIADVSRAIRTARRQPTPVDASTLGKQLAVQTVASARASRGIAFEILDYVIEPGFIPLVRARVRVRIADGSRIELDRVLATDTVVGEKQITAEGLAARVSREILTILRPHIRKLEPQWR